MITFITLVFLNQLHAWENYISQGQVCILIPTKIRLRKLESTWIILKFQAL